MRLGFLGAAGEVAGSCALVEAGEVRFPVDCGVFQGAPEVRPKNRRALNPGFDIRRLDCVLQPLAQACPTLLQPIGYGHREKLAKNLSASFHDTGRIPASASLAVIVGGEAGASDNFMHAIEEQPGWPDVYLPASGESVSLK